MGERAELPCVAYASGGREVWTLSRGVDARGVLLGIHYACLGPL